MSEFQNVGPLSIRVSRTLHDFFVRNIKDAKLIYDHGCGYGGWTSHIAHLVDGKAAIFDPDEDGCTYTKLLLGDRFVESTGPFDLIMCFGVLELLEEQDQEQLLKEFRLKLNGRLLIQYNFYNPLALRWLALRLKYGDSVAWHEKNRFHRTYFSRRHVETMFRKAGFLIVEKCHPTLENHLPFAVNNVLGPIIPSPFHMTFFYALEPVS